MYTTFVLPPALKSHLQSNLTAITPKIIALHLCLIPTAFQNKILNTILNQLFTKSLQEDELDFLENKALEIKVPDIKYHLVLSCHQKRLKVVNHMSADVSLSANFNDLILMLSRQQDPDTLFFQRRLCIEGNTALGLGVKNWLDSIDINIIPKHCQRLLQEYAQAVEHTNTFA